MTAGLEIRVTRDVTEFLASARELVTADPVTNTVMLTSLARLETGGRFSAVPPTFASALDGTRLVGAATCTPPYPVVLANADPRTAAALAVAFPGASGVHGTAAVAEAFADATRRPWAHDMHEVQYRLDGLRPAGGTTGRARLHGDSDVALVAEWLHAFATEAGSHQPGDVRADLAARLAMGGAIWLWEDGGSVVSLAGRTPPVAGVVRVGPVYTPPDRRGHGYASALTAAVCADAVERGATAVTLFTDAANPTSNSLYRRIGFVQVGVGVRIGFTDVTGSSRPHSRQR